MRQRVGIVGLVHDHVWGLLKEWDSLADVEIVAIAEPNQRLFAKVALHRSAPRFYHSWEELLQEPLDLVQITNENNAARPVEIEGLYGGLLERGFEYGPAFQGLQAAWRLGEAVFVEISLMEGEEQRCGSFGLHPALLDGALHGWGACVDGQENEWGLPFSWEGVRLHARGATKLRACISPAPGGAVSLVAVDERGVLLATVDSLAMRPLSGELLAASRGRTHKDLFALEWIEARAAAQSSDQSWVLLGEPDPGLAHSVDATTALLGGYPSIAALAAAAQGGAPVPAAALLSLAPAESVERADRAREAGSDGLAGAAHTVAHQTLELLQDWLAEPRFSDSRLVLVTRGAVAAQEGDGVPGLAQAPAWGVVRTAQSEHPGRFALIDLDDEDASWRMLAAALASGEPQLAIRNGRLSIPRLARVAVRPRDPGAGSPAGEGVRRFDPRRTVLITGGTAPGECARRAEPGACQSRGPERRGRRRARGRACRDGRAGEDR